MADQLQDQVAELQAQLNALQAQPQVQAIRVKAPPFWASEPGLWFRRLEAQFTTAGITAQKTMFNHVLAALDNATVLEIAPVVDNPRNNEEYNHIKEALLAAFNQTRESKNAALFALNGLGDRKPSSMMRHILSLASDDTGQPNGDTLVQAFFLAQLPGNVRSVLAGQTFANRDDLAAAADRIIESQQLAISSTTFHPSTIAASQPTRPFDTKNKSTKEQFICLAHKKYGTKAYTCKPGCLFGDIKLAVPPTGNALATRR